jgi:hypothetical protein
LTREDAVTSGKPVAPQRSVYPPQGTERAAPAPALLLDAHDQTTISERVPAPTRMAHAPASPHDVVAAPPSIASAANDGMSAATETPTVPAEALSKTQIADIQTYLAVRGFEAGDIDGLLGPQTRHAIRAFEAANDLPVTGAASPKLLSLLTEPTVSEPAPPTGTTAAVEPRPVASTAALGDLVQTAGAPMALTRRAADR